MLSARRHVDLQCHVAERLFSSDCINIKATPLFSAAAAAAFDRHPVARSTRNHANVACVCELNIFLS